MALLRRCDAMFTHIVAAVGLSARYRKPGPSRAVCDRGGWMDPPCARCEINWTKEESTDSQTKSLKRGERFNESYKDTYSKQNCQKCNA